MVNRLSIYLIGLLCWLSACGGASAGWVINPFFDGGGEPEPGILFQADFETDGQISWDSTPAAEDCDGYDAADDWCDYDTTQYHGGSHSLGLRGSYLTYVEKSLTGSSTEFYIDSWIRIENISNGAYSFRVQHSDGSADISCTTTSAGAIRIYYNNSASNLISDSSLISASTWYHIGIYYKQGTGNGILRVYLRSDATSFSYSDVVIESTSITTGTVDADIIRFRGADSLYIHWYDDIFFNSGDPGWPTS